MNRLILGLAQINPVVGDVTGNSRLILRAKEALAETDLVMTPELSLCGYPPDDLVLKPSFQKACRDACEALAASTVYGPALLVGLPWFENGKLYNAYALLDEGTIKAVRFKRDLPNYGVFDEKRVFAQGPLPEPVTFRGFKIGLPICEDLWGEEIVTHLAIQGAQMLLVPNASPYWRGKAQERLDLARQRARGLPLVYLNMVGGQDELVFDGGSFVLNGLQLPFFEESLMQVHFHNDGDTWSCDSRPVAPLLEEKEADYTACMLGLRDYVTKNGFPGVVLGLSGGIDSALCAALAVDALGPDRVHALMLPFTFTSQGSLDDAAACAKALGIRCDILPIASAVEGLETALQPLFEGTMRGVTEENLQSRIRGVMLMALSNKFGTMLVTTGNKSEMAVGYATLYGDMNGGFNPIKDLYKGEVYRLSHLRNAWKPVSALGPDGPVILSSILTKAPSAELRENQKDQDSLPPYDILDAILERLVEGEASRAALLEEGFDPETVTRIEKLLNLAEYKRRQAAPGVKITRRSFGRDRRYPIVNKFIDA